MVAGDCEAVGHVGRGRFAASCCGRISRAVPHSVADAFRAPPGLMRCLRVVVLGGRIVCGCSSRGFQMCFRTVFYMWEHMKAARQACSLAMCSHTQCDSSTIRSHRHLRADALPRRSGNRHRRCRIGGCRSRRRSTRLLTVLALCSRRRSPWLSEPTCFRRIAVSLSSRAVSVPNQIT